MVSIKDIARDAEVSTQTVSNCLNNPHIVKPITRLRVNESIKRLGYIPNASARRLRTRRSDTIAIGISPQSTSSIYDRLLHALLTETDTHHIRVILYKTDSKQEEIRQFNELSQGGDVDAFVLTGTVQDDPRISWLIEHGQTFVLFGRPWGMNLDDPRIPWVDVDGKSGIFKMTQHLIAQGYTRIGFLGWPDRSGTGRNRYLGWLQAMMADGRTGQIKLEGLQIKAKEGIAAGKKACLELLRRNPDLDAIVCVSDTLATGAIMALQRNSPVVVTGFDNSDSAKSLGFPTIDQPLTESARSLVRIIYNRLDAVSDQNASEENSHILLPPRLAFPPRN